MPTLKQNLLAEFLGSIPGGRGDCIDDIPFNLNGSTIVLAVFINALAVAFVLFALIETFGSISGAHFNPAVTLALLVSKDIDKRKAAFYIAEQFAGGFIGMLVAHLMFYGTTSTYYSDMNTLITVSSNVKVPALYFAGIHRHIPAGRSDHRMRARRLEAYRPQCGTGRRRYACDHVEHHVRQPDGYLQPDIHLCHLRHRSGERGVLHYRGGSGCSIGAAVFSYVLFPAKLKDKCDPFDCKKPITITDKPVNGGAK